MPFDSLANTNNGSCIDPVEGYYGIFLWIIILTHLIDDVLPMSLCRMYTPTSNPMLI